LEAEDEAAVGRDRHRGAVEHEPRAGLGGAHDERALDDLGVETEALAGDDRAGGERQDEDGSQSRGRPHSSRPCLASRGGFGFAVLAFAGAGAVSVRVISASAPPSRKRRPTAMPGASDAAEVTGCPEASLTSAKPRSSTRS